MAGLPAKPKLLKLPKKPKRSSGNSVFARYLERVAEVQRENARRVSAHRTAVSQRRSMLARIFGARPVAAVRAVRRAAKKKAKRKGKKRK